MVRFEKVNFSFFCINISIFLLSRLLKIKSSSKHENKIDIAKDIKYISLKIKVLPKILSIKNNEFLKIDFPNEKGELELFSLKETKTLSKKIQTKYPNIRTFRGYSDTRKNVILRITSSPQGISGTLRTPKGFVFLQPLKDSNTEHIFYRSNIIISKKNYFAKRILSKLVLR